MLKKIKMRRNSTKYRTDTTYPFLQTVWAQRVHEYVLGNKESAFIPSEILYVDDQTRARAWEVGVSLPPDSLRHGVPSP